MIQQAWAKEVLGASGLEATREKLQNCQQDLVDWCKNRLGRERHSLKFMYRRLDMLTKREHHDNLAEIKQVQGEINKLLEMEDIRW